MSLQAMSSFYEFFWVKVIFGTLSNISEAGQGSEYALGSLSLSEEIFIQKSNNWFKQRKGKVYHNLTHLKRMKNYKAFERVNTDYFVSICFELLH